MSTVSRSENGSSSFGVKRRWDDDVIFKNQARGVSETPKKEFVNDLLRTVSHHLFRTKKWKGKTDSFFEGMCHRNSTRSSYRSSSSSSICCHRLYAVGNSSFPVVPVFSLSFSSRFRNNSHFCFVPSLHESPKNLVTTSL